MHQNTNANSLYMKTFLATSTFLAMSLIELYNFTLIDCAYEQFNIDQMKKQEVRDLRVISLIFFF